MYHLPKHPQHLLPLRLAASSLTVPIPCRIGASFSASHVRVLLTRLCVELEKRLTDPVKVTHKELIRTVEVLGTIGYRIDSTRQVVVPGRITKAGKFKTQAFKVEIGHPLCTDYWIGWIIEYMDLVPERDSINDIFRSDSRGNLIHWLKTEAYRLLKSSRYFEWLRKQLIPEKLGLDPEVRKLALKARTTTRGRVLLNNIYSVVWRNLPDFRLVDNAEPGLLPLLLACIEEKRIAICLDPVQAIKSLFLEKGISEQGWRYTVKHGARIFRKVWEWSETGTRFDSAVNYLSKLQAANYPPPPPPSLLDTWFDSKASMLTDKVHFHPNWCSTPCRVLQVALNTAHELRRSAELPRFCQQFLEICRWAEHNNIQLDDNQMRAGWKWLITEFAAWDAIKDLQSTNTDIYWDSLIGPFSKGSYTAVPLNSSGDLITEARLMRNCLDELIDNHEEGSQITFSIRNRATGKRRADASFHFHEHFNTFLILEVKGKANSEPPASCWEMAHEIVERINKAYAQEYEQV